MRASQEQIEYANRVAVAIWKRLNSKLQCTIKEVNFRLFLVGGHGSNPKFPGTVYTSEYFELEVRAELMIPNTGSSENLEVAVQLALRDGWPDWNARKKTVDEAVNFFIDKIQEALMQCQQSITRHADNLGVLAALDQPPT